MNRLFLLAILFLTGFGLYFMQQSVYAQPNPIAESAQRQILDATIQIKMQTPRIDEIGNPVLAENENGWYVVNEMAHGLGAVVQIDNQLFIVTHDHWGSLLGTAVTVEYQDANGNLLTQISGDVFRSHIAYADHGTMVLQIPDTVTSTFPPSVSTTIIPLTIGNEVYVTRHQVGQENVEVVLARVTSLTQQYGTPTYQLETLDGSSFVHGDSGGGVWANGQFAGNLWETIFIETIELNAGHEISSEKNLTPYSIAAAVPDLTPYLSVIEEVSSYQTPSDEKVRP